jgi:hypothetical protein
MMKALTAVIFLLSSSAWAAQTVTISIVHPTRYSDNSTLPVSAIQGYKIYYEVDAVATEQSKSLTVGVVNSVNLTLDLAPRATPYAVHVAAQTLTAVGVSDLSTETSISKQIGPNIKPIAPVLIDIQIQCDVTCKVIDGSGL